MLLRLSHVVGQALPQGLNTVSPGHTLQLTSQSAQGANHIQKKTEQGYAKYLFMIKQDTRDVCNNFP